MVLPSFLFLAASITIRPSAISARQELIESIDLSGYFSCKSFLTSSKTPLVPLKASVQATYKISMPFAKYFSHLFMNSSAVTRLVVILVFGSLTHS